MIALALAAALTVVAFPGADLHSLGGGSGGAALGLLVPDAGPTTSEIRARAAIVRGRLRNSLHGDVPEGPVRIRLDDPRSGGGDMLIGIPQGGEQPNNRRYLVILHGRSGLLISDSTRIPGLVSAVDIAPTALGDEGALRVEPHDDPAGYLRALDERIRENGEARLPAAAMAALLIAALAFVFAPAAVLAFATLLAANLALGIAGVSGLWPVVATLAVAILAAVPLAGFASSLTLAAVGVAVVAAYGVAMAVDATSIALSPLGPSQNGRFYGISNLLETLILVPALVGAALLGRRLGALAFAGVALLAVVVVASSRLGADGGGAVVLAAGYAVLAAALVPPGRRTLAALLAAAALAGAVAVDLAVGPSTHVTGSLADGPAGLARDVWERVELSYLRATEHWAIAAVVAASVAALVALVVRGERRPLPLAFAVAIAVSLVVNDSPREVAILGLVGYVVLERFVRGGQATLGGYNPRAIVRGAEG